VYLYGGIAGDITDRKHLDLSLHASEAKLSQILDGDRLYYQLPVVGQPRLGV